MRSCVTVLGFALMGCDPELLPDPNPYAIFSNMPSAEVFACGKRMSLGVCDVEKGTELSKVNFGIQGYYEGTARIYSEACGIDYTVRFNQSQSFGIPLPGKLETNCLLAVALTPEYPGERNSGIVIAAIEAFVYLRAIDAQALHHNFISKIPASGADHIAFDAPKGTLMVRGCGAKLDKPIEKGLFVLPLSELPALGISRCIYEGVVLNDGPPVFFTWLVWKYADNFVPAAQAKVTQNGNNLEVDADPASFVIALDGQFKNGHKNSFDFDPDTSHVLRTLTVGGRNTLMTFEPKKGWLWNR